jgi:hypothetical protein
MWRRREGRAGQPSLRAVMSKKTRAGRRLHTLDFVLLFQP